MGPLGKTREGGPLQLIAQALRPFSLDTYMIYPQDRADCSVALPEAPRPEILEVKHITPEAPNSFFIRRCLMNGRIVVFK